MAQPNYSTCPRTRTFSFWVSVSSLPNGAKNFGLAFLPQVYLELKYNLDVTSALVRYDILQNTGAKIELEVTPAAE